MSETTFKIGRRVDVIGKNCQGTLSYIGQTEFATGKWFGVILDEPKGKNNGTVQGKTYFQCRENFGMFVRQSGLVLLDDSGNPVEMPSAEESTPKTRGKLSGSRMSLSSSRQSLAGSRASLAGSRTHLPTPKTNEKDTDAVQETSTATTPKRASFIETGFVETLRPQFTPGQALISPAANATVEEKLVNLQNQQEIDNLRSQVKDLTEKLETIKIKRSEDREKLKEYDKMKLQLEQLIEFKSKIMESQASLQRELQKAKHDMREAIEAKEQHAEEMADLAEAVEMTTLDKEMAEEKAETLQIELETAKEKIEELTLDLEIIKTEMQDRAGGTETKEGISTYEYKQLEQQNSRLRETLVRMRDFSAHEKHEHQKVIKDLDQKKSEIAELGRTKEKLSARVEEMEQQIADLQEQVDAALGSEEMVEQLSVAKLTLEDQVKKLEEELTETEALLDMNEQIVESNAEIEMDLREELDLAHAAKMQAIREKEAAIETISDHEQTINKFRELVQKLVEQTQDLQQRLQQNETSGKNDSLAEILDFQKMFAETKAHTKAIDLELRNIDIQQCLQHVKYLTAYMPDTFMNRGGDHDAVLVLLLLPRMLWKSEILLNQLRDKFPVVEAVDKSAIVKGHSVARYAFRLRLSYYLYQLQAILHKYITALNTCRPETLLKVGGSHPEMCGQEKALDQLMELLKRDQLDESVPTESLERCVYYFGTVYPTLVAETDGQLNHTQLLSDSVKALTAAMDNINIEATVMRTIVQSTVSAGDMELLSQHVITSVEQIQQQLRLVKRRLPTDTSVTNLGFKRANIEEILQHCASHISKVMKVCVETVKQAVQSVIVSGDTDMSIPHDKLKELAINASDRIYEGDDLGPVQNFKNSLAFVLTEVTQIVQFLQENEYNISTGVFTEEKVTPPIIVRAQSVKQEMEETKNLKNKLETRDADVKELKKLIKQKQDELSEMVIRKELAEKKLGNVNKDYELTIDKLQRKLDETQCALKRKEKEFEETMDHLQADIDSLENEKGELKDKLKLYSKKVMIEGMVKSGAGTLTQASLQPAGANLPCVVNDSPLLLQQLRNAKKVAKNERNKRLALQTSTLHTKLNSLEPLSKITTLQNFKPLENEVKNFKNALLSTFANVQVIDLTDRKPGTIHPLEKAAPITKVLQQSLIMRTLADKAEQLRYAAMTEAAKSTIGIMVTADFATFPSSEQARIVKEKECQEVAQLIFPRNKVAVVPNNVQPLTITHKDLLNIHKRILS